MTSRVIMHGPAGEGRVGGTGREARHVGHERRCRVSPALSGVLALGLLGRSPLGPATTEASTTPQDVELLLADSPTPWDGKFEPVPEHERVRVEVPPPEPYRIGIGDALYITIPGQEEFIGLGESGAGDIVGIRVKEDGNVYLPEVRKVQAEGKTVFELQDADRGEAHEMSSTKPSSVSRSSASTPRSST